MEPFIQVTELQVYSYIFQNCSRRRRSVIGEVKPEDIEKTFVTANVMHILPTSSAGSLLGRLCFLFNQGFRCLDYLANAFIVR